MIIILEIFFCMLRLRIIGDYYKGGHCGGVGDLKSRHAPATAYSSRRHLFNAHSITIINGDHLNVLLLFHRLRAIIHLVGLLLFHRLRALIPLGGTLRLSLRLSVLVEPLVLHCSNGVDGGLGGRREEIGRRAYQLLPTLFAEQRGLSSAS